VNHAFNPRAANANCTTDYLTWFEHELAELQSSSKVNLKIHLTGQRISKSDISSPFPTPSPDEEQENVLFRTSQSSTAREKGPSSIMELGRPDIDTVIKQAVDASHHDDRILVAASGPVTMLSSTRIAVKSCMSSQNASIHLHLEEFGW
jgi:hypothetical protein